MGAFWTVEWQSEFHLNTVTNQISGHITARTHYQEQVNNFEQKVKHTCEPQILGKLDADAVVGYIERQELQMHSDLEEAHESLKSGFKRVRRQIPVTGAKFDWDRLKLIQ